MTPLNPNFAQLGTTIFTVMSALAVEHDAINLGQGFPDEDGPEALRRAAAAAIVAGPNQYPPMMGVPALRQAVAAHDARFYGLDWDWQSEILVTSGATEALAAALFGLLSPGDEVVLFEPLYDSYLPIIRQAGAVPRIIRLEPPDWSIPAGALDQAFGPRTKLVLFNTPMNPTGKVFTMTELQALADRLARWDALALCDEVYEHLVFDGARHVPLATLPGMKARTVRVMSAGKTFSLTGWKVGYLAGPAPLMAPIAKAHQFLTFTTAPHLQLAVAEGLGFADSYYKALVADMAAKRDRLVDGLRQVGYETLPVGGSYFVTARIGGRQTAMEDDAYCRWLTAQVGVAAVPVSAFYALPDPPRDLVRFCFCKRPAVLDAAVERLARGLVVAA